MFQRLCRDLAAPVAAILLNVVMAPASAVAQWDDDGFSFDEEEVEDFSEPLDFSDDEWTDDAWDAPADDGWGTTPDPTPTAPAELATVTGLIVPGNALDPAFADQLTNVLLSELHNIEGAQVVGNDALRDEFEIMGSELAYECAFDPVCLGRYGRQLSIGRIVVGRVVENPDGTWGTTIDLFHTATSSIVNYRYFETPARTVSVQESLPAQLRLLFGIREQRGTASVGRSGPSTAQVALAWSSAGLAVGALAAGVVFGLKANSIESDLNDCASIVVGDRRVCTTTQQDAVPRIDDARSAAKLSNVMIGTGVFLGVISVVLFTVTPGGDIDEDAVAARPRDWRISPAVSRDGFGLSGAVGF